MSRRATHLASVTAATVALVGSLAACGGGSQAVDKNSQAFRDAVRVQASRIAASQEAERAKAEAQASALAEAQASAAPLPAPSDFTINVKILSKECFGSAGCNITYRIDPSYHGTGDATSLEVTYEVLGDEDGPQINTFTIDSAGTASFEKEETLSTPSPSTRVTARVTDVERSQ